MFPLSQTTGRRPEAGRKYLEIRRTLLFFNSEPVSDVDISANRASCRGAHGSFLVV